MRETYGRTNREVYVLFEDQVIVQEVSIELFQLLVEYIERMSKHRVASN